MATNNNELLIRIRADLGNAQTALNNVAREMAQVGTSAQQARARVDPLMAALSRSPSGIGIRISQAFNEAGQAAAAATAQVNNLAAAEDRAAAAAARANGIYQQHVSRLTQTAQQQQASLLSLQGLNAGQIQHIQSLERSRAAALSNSSVVAGLRAQFLQLFAAYQLIQSVKDVVNTAADLQDTELRLRTLTGTAEQYAQTQAYLIDLATRHHKEYFTLANASTRLIATEKEGLITHKQSIAILEGMSNASSALGVSNADLQLSMRGVIQQLNNSTVQWDEMRQATDPMPGLLQKIVKASGLTTSELKELAQTGDYTTTMFKDNLITALESYQGAAERTGGTIHAQYADIKNAYIELVRLLEEPISDVLTPLLNGMKSVVQGLAQDFRELKAVKDDLFGPSVTGGAPDNGMTIDLTGRAQPPDYAGDKAKETADAAKANYAARHPEKPAKPTRASSARSGGSARTQTDPTEQFDKQIAQLEREIALRGEVTEIAKVQYDIQQGAYKQATREQQITIQKLAYAKDDLAAQDKAAKKQQAYWDQAVKDANAYYDLRKQIAELSDTELDSSSFSGGLAKIQDMSKELDLSADQSKALYDQLGKSYNESFIDPASKGTQALSEFGIQAARNMQSSFANFLFDPFSEGMDGMLSGFVDVLRKMVAEAAAAQILDMLVGSKDSKGAGNSGLIGTLFSGISSAFGGIASANGNAFNHGSLLAFAAGGVVNRATAFPLANGQSGLMGEAGPEAILPLQRNSAGKLGVVSTGGGDITISTQVNVTGGKDSTSGNEAMGDNLGSLINAAVKNVIINEKRPGGMLARG